MRACQETKDSGVAWLGKIPAEWEVKKAKYIYKRVQQKPLEGDGVVTAFRDGEVVLRSLRREDGFTFADKEIGYQHVRKGDLVIHAMDAFAGAVGISKSDGKMSPVCSICRPQDDDKTNTKYYAYLLREMTQRGYLVAIAKGIRERSTDFRYKDFSDLQLSVPTVASQQKIVDYISTETTKIDDLITKQERLLQLLGEKRRATITHAVTRGLDPHAKLKETNTPWLGKIPEHWTVMPIKSVARINNGADYKDIEVNEGEGYPVIGSGGEFARASKYAYDGKSVLFGRKGTIDKPLYVNGRFWTVDTMFWSKINEKKIVPRFLYFLALSIPYDYYQTKTALPSMTQSNLLNHPIAIPDTIEQEKIISYLNEIETEIDELKQKIQTQITLLRERRTSLVSHAVTGKIKI